MRRRSPPPTFVGFVNYDLFGEQVDDQTSLGSILDIGVFGSRGVVTNSLIGRHDDDRREVLRLDSTWTLDFPERLATLRVGDAISASGAWGRSARFGGVQFGTNFSTQPTLVTTPLLYAQGEAIVPSTVDVFVNGRRVASEDVPPGPFTIDRLPPITGAGQMQVVVTDALGRQQVISQPYYTGQTLLRAGLNEYSFEAGAIREDYALRSNAYGDLVMAGTFRRGITDRFTAEVHAEGQADGASAAGVDTAWQVGTLGILTLTAAAGGDDEIGWLGGMGFEHNGQQVNVFARTQYATEDWPTRTSEQRDRPKQRSFGGLGFNLGHYGNLQFSYGQQTQLVEPDDRDDRAQPFGHAGRVRLPWLRREPHDQRRLLHRLFLNWTMPFGDRRTAAVSVQYSPDVTAGEEFEAVASMQQSLPAGAGTGYYVAVSSTEERGPTTCCRATPAWSACSMRAATTRTVARQCERRARHHRRGGHAVAAARSQFRGCRGRGFPGHDRVRREPAGRSHGQQGPRAARFAARVRAQRDQDRPERTATRRLTCDACDDRDTRLPQRAGGEIPGRPRECGNAAPGAARRHPGACGRQCRPPGTSRCPWRWTGWST